jgi:hypothetical protein
MTHIARKIVKPGEPSLVTHRFHGLGGASKPKTGRSKRILSRAAASPHVFAG